MDTGLLILRLVVGLFLIGHGTQKLFGWFGGYGLSGTGGFLESLGYRPGRLMAALAGIGEAGGGLLLALGFLTPLGSVAVLATMLNAVVAAHRGKGPWATDGGWELPVTYGTVAIALAYVGPGAWSLDEALDLHLSGTAAGAITLALALAIGMLTAALRRPDVIDITDEDEVTTTDLPSSARVPGH